MPANSLDSGKAGLRDDFEATIGFEGLGALTGQLPKRLPRMFGPGGNSQARNLFEIIACRQEREGLHLEVQAVWAVEQRSRETV